MTAKEILFLIYYVAQYYFSRFIFVCSCIYTVLSLIFAFGTMDKNLLLFLFCPSVIVLFTTNVLEKSIRQNLIHAFDEGVLSNLDANKKENIKIYLGIQS